LQTLLVANLVYLLAVALLIIMLLLFNSLRKNRILKAKNLELEAAKENSEKALETRAYFLTTILHEIRTPLYAIRGLTHLLLEENHSKKQKEHLKSLKFSGEHLFSIVNSVLEINKFEARKESFDQAPYNLEEHDEETSKDLGSYHDFLRNKKILIVEDNRINQVISRKFLERNKMIGIIAEDGFSAIEKVKKELFDLILMDINMPGMNGITATKKIRSFNKKIPIIALSSITIEDSVTKLYEAGFNNIVQKPYKSEELLNKIYENIKSSH